MEITPLAFCCVCIALAGCPWHPPPPPTRAWEPPPLRPASGALAFTVDDANDTLDRTTTLDLGDPAIDPRCVPWLRAARSPGATDDELPFDLVFDCYYEPGLRLILRVRGLPDPRRWQQGEIEVPLEEGAVEVTHIYGGEGRGAYTSCTSHGEGARLRAVITEAGGGPRPYPELADPDLLRLFTLDLQVPAARGEPYAEGRRPCPVVSVTVSAGYEMTGASLRPPEAPAE